MPNYIIGLDQSTQGTKALLFNHLGELVKRIDRPHRQIVNKEGWVEHDPEEIYQNSLSVIKTLIESSGIEKSEIAALGITNQRETTVAFHPDGTPFYPAIVWQCARAQHICDEIAASGYAKQIKEVTGLELSPYFSAAKMAWILDNIPNAKELSKAGKLKFGTIDTYLIYRLTRGSSYVTDYSNASRTQLMNLKTLTWDKSICDIFQVPLESLPKMQDSDSYFGETDIDGFLPKPIPIHAVLGDSQGALFGQGCIKKGMVKVTYGTGSSVMMTAGDHLVETGDGIVSSVGWKINGEVTYVIEGNINYAGAVITWLKDDLKLFDTVSESEELAKLANPMDTVYLIPAFTGLGAPYWVSDAKGMICGMTRNTKREEIVRAGLDSIAYQIHDVLERITTTTGIKAKELRVDGGATKNDYLMQFQSDITQMPLYVAETEELSCLGVAYLAGMKINLYPSNITSNIKYREYEAKMLPEEVHRKVLGWKDALSLIVRDRN